MTRYVALPVDTRRAIWARADGLLQTFVPNGRKRSHGKTFAKNPVRWEAGADIWGARLFVGFNVGRETVYTMEDLIPIVRSVREEQTGDPSSSFLSQHGIYRHKEGDIVEEPGAQVIIINLTGTTPQQFENQMVALAEEIAEQLHQEEVVVEIQRSGLVQRVFGVGAVDEKS